MRNWLIPALLALSGCVSSSSETIVVDPSELGPVPADIRPRITAWANGFFLEPQGLRGVRISDPVPTRDGNGTQLWLVCLEADAPSADGGYLGPQRFAFGFGKAGTFTAPLQRAGSRLASRDCDRLPLTWSPWPGLERLAYKAILRSEPKTTAR